MTQKTDEFDVIVIGGGHAGAEAAWAACNLGATTAMVTMDPTKIGAMSCNPAIGGLAKGQMVREIDALGGLMGLATDATGIQFRVLNASKGSAVRGPRAQCDKYRYAAEVQRLLATRDNLTVIAGTVESIEVERARVSGVIVRHPTSDIRHLHARAVVLTTGTFMRGLMHSGETKTEGGRVGEGAAVGISGALRGLGFELGRLKTGTPPRLAAESIDFDQLQQQPGDDRPQPFSDMTGAARFADSNPKPTDADVKPTDSNPKPTDSNPWASYNRVASQFPVQPQVHCWLTETSEPIHDHIRANLHRAPMYNGQIAEGRAGPRYCPSIEDKVVRFEHKASHHVFLEPESLDTNEIYCNGISTSLPADVQDFIVRRLPGCEHARVLKYGYAVEYDMVWPHQIDATCMTKRVEGLFLAGQINGTSGYEEAAGQGLVAGLNAVRHVQGRSLVRLRRDQAYVGVMLDDLVTKTPREPYRMFTSRAEYRLMLRADNADQRLTPLARDWGLIDDARWQAYEQRMTTIDLLRRQLDQTKHDGKRLTDWVKQPQIDADWVLARLEDETLPDAARDHRLVARVVADIQYAGYVARQQRDVDRLSANEGKALPVGYDYARVTGLRREAQLTLSKFQPATFGQAARLAGITPADVMLVSVALGR